MIGLDIAVVLLGLTALGALARMVAGPSETDRVVAGDLLTFSVVGLIALLGVRLANEYTFDVLVVASLLAFLGALSLARALTRGVR